jgi:hypothetical protein
MKRMHTIAAGVFAALMSTVAVSAHAQSEHMGGKGPGMMGHGQKGPGMTGQGHNMGPGAMGQGHNMGAGQHGATGPGEQGGTGMGPMAGGCPMMSAMSGGQGGHKH